MAKLRLLIADDEPRICSLLKTLIHWDALPLELIGFCYDGESCFARIQETHPDIVITDIRMPGMTGLDLMKACKEAKLSTHFIVVSGFTQFDYAYHAIKYGVDDFLLKPIGESELNGALERLAQRIIGERQSSAQEEATGSIQGGRSMLVALARQELPPQECDAAHLQRFFGVAFPGEICIAGRIHLDKKDATGSYLYHLQEQFSRILHSAMESTCLLVDLPLDSQMLFLINHSPEQQDMIQRRLQSCLTEMLDAIQPYPFMRLTLGIVREIRELPALPDAFALTQKLCESRFLLGTGRILDDSILSLPVRTMPAYPQEYKNRLMDGLKSLDPAQGKELLRTLFREGMPGTEGFPYLFWAHAMQLGAFALLCLDSLVSLGKSYTTELESMKSALHSASEKDELLNQLLSYFEDLLTRLQQENQNSENKIIQVVKSYVCEHFHERLELEDVAGQVYLNPTYLGTFFKRETGMNFSEYLTSVRIEEAKKLLTDMQYNINEIAGRVGYKDAHYFSRLFQKQVGIKPAEYRKLRHKQQLFQ